MLDVVQQKQATRAEALARRGDIPQALREQKSATISSQLAANSTGCSAALKATR